MKYESYQKDRYEMLFFPQSELNPCYPEHFLASLYWTSMTAPADVYWAYSPGVCPTGGTLSIRI